MKIEYTEDVTKQLTDEMHQGHLIYEKGKNIDIHYKRFAFVIRDSNQKLIGALVGYTAFADVAIDDLWVDESYRKQGLGRKLLDMVEKKFENTGFDNISLITNEFQAPDFYLKCGYELEFKRNSRKSPQLNKYYFIKWISE